MKKIMSLLLILSMVALPMALASSMVNIVQKVGLAEKDSNWDVVEDGAHGVMKFTTISRFGKLIQQRVQVTVYDLEPKTKYQLIYYGDEDHNDVWNHATCIGKERRTSTKGYFKSGSTHIPEINNGVDEKFWVVKASDVDCKNKVMAAWNPEEYLFEMNTV